MNFVGFDIETIPQQEKLSRAQEEWLAKKIATSKNLKNETEEEIKRRILSTSPYGGEIVCIGLGEIKNNTIITNSIIGEEKEILEKFWEMIKPLKNTTYVSFNGLSFDVNFISMRSMHHKIFPTNRSFLNTIKYQKYPHFDVMQWMADWGFPKPGLDIACELAKVKSSKEGAIRAKDVERAYKDGRIKEIAEYCEEDVRATLELYIRIRPYIRD